MELLIAVVHGPRDEFDHIQQIPTFTTDDQTFDWLRDHKTIDPMPKYVMDKHTSNPDPSISFALDGSKVVGGDIQWSPESWLLVYTLARIKNISSIDNIMNISKKIVKLEASVHAYLEGKKEYYTGQPSLRMIASPPRNANGRLQQKNIKYLESLPKLSFKDIKEIIMVHNNNSRKAPVVTVKMIDQDAFVVIKLMKKNFGYGLDQNFVQNVKDSKICGFKYLHPMPDSGKYRGLMRGNFDIIKTNDPRKAHMIISPQTNIYFLTGCVTQNKGKVVDARFSHCKTVTIVFQEMLNIIMFRMLMSVNNTNHSNILVGEGGRLYSVDENYVGSMTPEEIMDTQKCKHLKKLLSKQQLLVESYMPDWMFEEDKRLEMLNLIKIQGEMNGICEKTIDKIAVNSKELGPKIIKYFSQ